MNIDKGLLHFEINSWNDELLMNPQKVFIITKDKLIKERGNNTELGEKILKHGEEIREWRNDLGTSKRDSTTLWE